MYSPLTHDVWVWGCECVYMCVCVCGCVCVGVRCQLKSEFLCIPVTPKIRVKLAMLPGCPPFIASDRSGSFIRPWN